MAAPMQEVVVDDKANAFTSDNKTKPNLTQSKELLNIHDQNGISERLLVNKKCKETKSTAPKKTYRLPPSSVLTDVKKFLPQMAKANEDLTNLLSRVPASMVDIESVSEDAQNVIEMNISLVPDLDSDESEDSDCDSDTSDVASGEVTEENFKITQTNRQMQNRIVEIDKDSEDEKT